MYGKIINGNFSPAPNPMVVGKYKVYNPSPEIYTSQGYLEIIETAPPADGKNYTKTYRELNGVICIEWIEAEKSERPPVLEERVSAIEAQVTDTQLALCELYEALCAADSMEV